MARLLFVLNDAPFFLSHRLPLALAAQAAGHEVIVGTPEGDGVDAIRAHGLTHPPLPLTRSGRNPLREAWALLSLILLFRRLKPDLVHLVTIKPVMYGGIAARIAGVPGVVAAISGLGFMFIRKGWRATLMRSLIGRLYGVALGHPNQRIIFQNSDDRDSVIALTGLPLAKTILIRGSGVDLQRYIATPLPDTAITVMLAARFLVDKGVREFVEAARALRQAGSPARFVLVGSIDPANPATLSAATVDGWISEGIIECWGQRSDMPAVLASAHIVVLPSYREGMPKVLLEAAACARAVVTTDVPGCRDAIEAGVTGLLVPLRDAGALATALHSLIKDPARCRAMGLAGRALAERAFDVRQVVARHLQIYQEVSTRS